MIPPHTRIGRTRVRENSRVAATGVLALAMFTVAPGPTSTPSDVTHFESPHVRPAVLTPSGDRLLVVNTPEARLSVFDVTGTAPVRVGDLPVGLEPVAVNAFSDSVAWVVNRLSDDVSVVDLATLHVRATLRVGDEPADVVFAGSPPRAYVSVGGEDAVKAYDPADLSAPPVVVALPGRAPRALARDGSGSHVWVALFEGGNRTSVLSPAEAAGGHPAPSPPMSGGLPAAPEVGLIIQQDAAGDWRDESGQLWNHRAGYSLPDADLVEIATAGNTVSRTFGGLSSLNMALAVRASDGLVATSGTEARNLVRFAPNLAGRAIETRLGLVTAGGASSARALNPHIDPGTPGGSPAERDSSLAIPSGLAWSADGARLYVSALGSDRLALVDPAAPPAGLVLARRPTVAGPTGIVVDAGRARLYVVGRLRNELQTLDANTLASVAVQPLGFDPTPDDVVHGRRLFYSGTQSAHGDLACASCHAYGGADGLAWDLGDPTGAFQPAPPAQLDPFLEGHHPMKGPMVTRALHGPRPHRRLQWRGDRDDFAATGEKFVSLLGRASLPADSQLAALSGFVSALTRAPNPRQRLDRAYADAPSGQASAHRGRQVFLTTVTDGARTCVDCHSGPDGGRTQVVADAALGGSQDMRIAPLAGLAAKSGFDDSDGATSRRGFGFSHDGSAADLAGLLRTPAFTAGPTAEADLADLVAFLLAFDAGTAPAVGRQITLAAASPAPPALDTLRARALAGDCDVIATGRAGGRGRSWLYLPASGDWDTDRAAEAPVTTAALLGTAGPATALTFTGVPRGSGARMALDRDRDGHRNGDEAESGSDPGDPASTPLTVSVGPMTGAPAGPTLGPNPFRSRVELRFQLSKPGRVSVAVYDVLGRRVRQLARDQAFAPGWHALAWDGLRSNGTRSAAGIYFIRMEGAAGRHTRTAIRMP
jgi:YVTN family beta-propeller protein